MTFTGFSGLPGGLRATEPGVLRGRLTWVVMKHGGEWQIVSQQITPFPPQE
jgi:ketosteroid isomerase-like protein